jgi:hypothetical protein
VAVFIETNQDTIKVQYAGITRLEDLIYTYDYFISELSNNLYYVIYDLTEVMYTVKSISLIDHYYRDESLFAHHNVMLSCVVLPDDLDHPRSQRILEQCQKHNACHKVSICRTTEEAYALIQVAQMQQFLATD